MHTDLQETYAHRATGTIRCAERERERDSKLRFLRRDLLGSKESQPRRVCSFTLLQRRSQLVLRSGLYAYCGSIVLHWSAAQVRLARAETGRWFVARYVTGHRETWRRPTHKSKVFDSLTAQTVTGVLFLGKGACCLFSNPARDDWHLEMCFVDIRQIFNLKKKKGGEKKKKE